MRTHAWTGTLALVAFACSSGGGPGAPDAGTGVPDAGAPPPAPSWSAPAPVDSATGAGLDLVTARDPAGRLAAAYFTKKAAAQYDLVVAREQADGAWTTDVAQAGLTGHFGVALAFEPEGNPVVAYLGGGTADAEGDGRWHSFETGTGTNIGASLPSDAVISRRGAGGWTAEVVARLSDSIVATGFPIDDHGVVTGLFPSLAIGEGGVTHLVVRDLHYGSDDSATAASNLEYRRSTGATKVAGELVAGGPSDPDHLNGAGNGARMLLVDGEPALSFVLAPASIDDATQVWFARRDATGWRKVRVSAASGKPGNPPSLAHAKDAGFALAFYDADGGDLVVGTSKDGAAWTTSTVEALGDTGLHPALAFGAGEALGLLYAFCRGPTEAATPCSARRELRFRLHGATWGDYERVAGTMPEGASLLVDAAGRFAAVWHEPGAGVVVSRRTP